MRWGLLGRGTQDKAQSGGAALTATGRGCGGRRCPSGSEAGGSCCAGAGGSSLHPGPPGTPRPRNTLLPARRGGGRAPVGTRRREELGWQREAGRGALLGCGGCSPCDQLRPACPAQGAAWSSPEGPSWAERGWGQPQQPARCAGTSPRALGREVEEESGHRPQGRSKPMGRGRTVAPAALATSLFQPGVREQVRSSAPLCS